MKTPTTLALFFFALSVLAPSAFAEPGSPVLSGSFDFYYQSSPQAHSPAPALAGPQIIEGRFFDRHVNQMTLNLAEITFKHQIDRTSFVLNLGFGEVVDQMNGGGSQSVTGTNPTNTAANEPTRNLLQATLTHAFSDRVSVMLGKFPSYLGLELTKAKDNWQYSRSFTFNYALPIWHEGAALTYAAVPNSLNVSLYLLNGWDGRISAEQNESMSSGLNLNFTGLSGLAMNYNYFGGSESAGRGKREIHELNLTYELSPAWSVAMEYVRGTQTQVPVAGRTTWSGFTAHAKGQLTDSYSLSPRIEFFDDSKDGFALTGGLAAAGTPLRMTSYTLTNQWILQSNLEARFEIRSDRSSEKAFLKDSSGTPTNHQESYLLAVLYGF